MRMQSPDLTAQVFSDGKVTLKSRLVPKNLLQVFVMMPITGQSFCPINMQLFPFDQQKCEFVVRTFDRHCQQEYWLNLHSVWRLVAREQHCLVQCY